MSDLKAYRVDCSDDDHGCKIVFAARAKDVSRYAHSDFCDCPWIERRVRRAPSFDDLSPGPMTVEKYLSKGWWWECTCCGSHRYEDEHPVIVNEFVFCNDDCVLAYIASYEDSERLHESLTKLLSDLQSYLDGKGLAHGS